MEFGGAISPSVFDAFAWCTAADGGPIGTTCPIEFPPDIGSVTWVDTDPEVARDGGLLSLTEDPGTGLLELSRLSSSSPFPELAPLPSSFNLVRSSGAPSLKACDVFS